MLSSIGDALLGKYDLYNANALTCYASEGNVMFLCRFQLFELMQGGQQQSYYTSHGPSSAPAVFANPWVRHFKPKVSRSEHGYNLPLSAPVDVTDAHVKEVSAAIDVTEANLTYIERDRSTLDAITLDCDVENKEESGASEDVVYNYPQCGAEVLEIDQGLRLWQSRLHKGGQTMANPSNRKDMASRVLKRPLNVEVENGEHICHSMSYVLDM